MASDFPLTSLQLDAPTPSNSIELSPIGTIKTGGFDEGAAEITAYDPETQRLFVVNAEASTIDVVDLGDPTNPQRITTLDVSAIGSPNSVAVSRNVLAVAIENANVQLPGKVAFYQVDSLKLLNALPVGALPDMVTFTPDGKYVLIANEAEPNTDYTVDPEGSVSIIKIPNGIGNIKKLKPSDVVTAGFSSFNARKAELLSQGVRIFGPNATVAQDFEPEYIAVSSDSQTAYVTLQENNAYAVVNIATGQVTDVIPFGYKDYSQPTSATLANYAFGDLPVLGTTDAGQEVEFGGFSGLFFEGYSESGNYKFISHTDRGPNGEPVGVRRPFLLPDFAPELVRFELNPNTGEITITERIQLKRSDGTPLTGLSNTSIIGGNGNTAYNDEIPVDLRDNALPLDPLGADLEGIAVDPNNGSLWMVDEYRPAIYHFDATGLLIDRLVPQGTVAAYNSGRPIAEQVPAGYFGTEVLPAVLAQRRQNRGFEAVALQDGKVYAFVQSPLRNPTTLSNTALNGMRNIRIVELDPVTNATKQYLYVLDNPDVTGDGNTRADKIGDAAAIGNGQFLVVERDDDAIVSDPSSAIEKKIYRFSLAGATDISTMTGVIGDTGKTVDQLTPAELAANDIHPIAKYLHVDLNAVGYNTVEKVEGLAFLGPDRIAVINDNDFGVAGITIDFTTGTFIPDPSPDPVVLGIIDTKTIGLDASDRDNRINIAQHPVFGMYQPDAILSYTVGGVRYLITANEGDARDYEAFAEERRVGALTLDPVAFPNGAALKNNAVLGRLGVTNSLGDTDGDGDFDQLYAFGGRSFSIWTEDGTLVFDSGDELERIIAEVNPEFFHASNTDNTFDSRSDNKGVEPEGIITGVVGDRTYAFIGLERQSGIMVYDVTNPIAPSFVQYIDNRDFTADPESPEAGDLGPEGLIFVTAANSPNGVPLLVVANEISGTVTVYEITVPPMEEGLQQILTEANVKTPDKIHFDAGSTSAIVEQLPANFARHVPLLSELRHTSQSNSKVALADSVISGLSNQSPAPASTALSVGQLRDAVLADWDPFKRFIHKV